MKKLSILVIALAMLMAITGIASAAVLPNATPETQGISTSTVIQCDGLVLTDEHYASELSNQVLDGAPLATEEVYSQSTYNNRISAVKGVTTYVKTIDANNKNQLVTGENVATAQTLLFSGASVTGEESAAIFNAGQATSGTEKFMCPFTSAATTTVPPFNEMAIMGSHYGATQLSATSQVGITGVAKTGDVPSTIHMNLEATGVGSIGTFMGVNAQDARGTGQTLITPAKVDKCGKVTKPAVYSPVTPSSVVQYHESTTAMGTFVFGKNMQYTSGVA